MSKVRLITGTKLKFSSFLAGILVRAEKAVEILLRMSICWISDSQNSLVSSLDWVSLLAFRWKLCTDKRIGVRGFLIS